jgi:ABC-2 type transport system permease protein
MTPGSLPWLVMHELRLWSRDGSRNGRVARTIAVLVLLLMPIGFGISLALVYRTAPDVPSGAIGPLSAACAGLVLLMLSGAIIYVMRSFHDRGDLDLLLAAPIPPARVMAAKSLAIHASVALPLLFITAPFLLASAAVGHPGWLGAIIMVIISAVTATSLAFVLVAALFRRLGARRGRIVVQIGGGVFAAGVAILAQVPNLAPERWRQMMAVVAQPPTPPLDWPARAALGSPLPLLALAGLAVAGAGGASRLAAHRLADANPGETAADRASTTGTPRPRFRAGSPRTLLMKELRLLWRDSELLSSIALQLAYMVPAFALIFSGGGVSPARLASASVLFSGLLASSLGWLTICGEDAPDLIAAAPVTAAEMARMKVLAACTIPLAMVSVPVLLTLVQDRTAGLTAILLCPVAAVTAALQQGWAGKPQRRKAFRFRQKGSLLLAVSEYVMAGAWSTTAAMLARGSAWAAVSGAAALLVLAASRWLFPRDPDEI